MIHGSLFSGIGGFELGAKRAGIKTIWNCEINPFCRMILKKHFPETTQYTDITTLKNPPYVDIISGGFPCQDISIANPKGEGLNGKRSGLWKEMLRIICEARPSYVLIENSPELLRKGFSSLLQNLSEAGYDAEWQCLQARNFNLPHKRERIFIIAYTKRLGHLDNIIKTCILQKILSKKISGQTPLPMPIKRFNAESDYRSVRMYNGFSKELDTNRITALGNAVIPSIAQYLFECIKEHHILTQEVLHK
ncbi:DNA cytosine methyltransferase [Treponema denticola]|uniref:DNA cytosine methyltransferase n=1 Tax=Treponema denticola TaxID=158 RepID=UPI000354061E|nr:DNA cytosine methyltransferase [Treponema denticola]EPF37707.1 DNA (cytosine-5-)-methyltransferase [Treponema denticola SP32]